MKQKYEYKFVRLRATFWGGLDAPEQSYREEIWKHAQEGWRLVQIFAPSTQTHGQASFYELILEREVG